MADWKWWSGPDEETYNGPFETKACAIEELCGEPGYVCEAYQDPIRFSDLVRFQRMMEDAEEDGLDYMGDSDRSLFNITDVQMQDLEQRLKFACNQWQIANSLVFKPYTFTKQRNEEFIHGQP